MEAVLMFFIGPVVIGAIPGLLVFFAMKRLFARPGVWLRVCSALLSSAIAIAAMIAVTGHIAAQQAGHRGDGYLFVGMLVYVFGTPIAAIAAFITGLGVGQKWEPDRD